MSKTRVKDKWEIERDQRTAQRKALFERLDAITDELRMLGDDIRVTGKKYANVRFEPRARDLVESAHYSIRRLRSGNLIR